MADKEKTGTTRRPPPRGLLRWLLRLPIVFYRLRLGWLFGRRFLLLVHVGRKSGKERSTVLEVVHYDDATHRCLVASGWGAGAQWYQNVLKEPRIRYTVGVRERAGIAARLPIEGAERELQGYGSRHPRAIRNLTEMMIGERFEGSAAQYHRLAEQVPVVELSPADARA